LGIDGSRRPEQPHCHEQSHNLHTVCSFLDVALARQPGRHQRYGRAERHGRRSAGRTLSFCKTCQSSHPLPLSASTDALSLAATLVAPCRLNPCSCAHNLPFATGWSSGSSTSLAAECHSMVFAAGFTVKVCEASPQDPARHEPVQFVGHEQPSCSKYWQDYAHKRYEVRINPR